MNAIEKAIAESRERQEKSTPVVAWYPHPYLGGVDSPPYTVRGPFNRWFALIVPWEEQRADDGRIVRADAADDVRFAAGAMNMEPRFRDALEMAVADWKTVEAQLRVNPSHAGVERVKAIAERALARIEAILSGMKRP